MSTDTRPGLLKCLATGLLSLLLAACGGSGGGGSGGGGGGTAGGGNGGGGSSGGGTTPADVAGTWTITQSFTDDCDDGDATETLVLTITQEGDTLTVVDRSGNTFSGTIDGTELSWNGSYPEDGGTTTITSLTATVDGDTLSGTSTWTWSDSSLSCSGTTSFEGTRSSEPSALAAPADLAARALSWNSVELDWVDDSDNEVGFTIERRRDDGGDTFTEVGEVGRDVTDYVDSDDLAGSTTYIYRVRAYNGRGASDYSDVASVTTPAESTISPPEAPTGASAEATDHTAIAIEWMDNAVDEDGFIIERRSGSTEFAELRRIGPYDPDRAATGAAAYTDETVLDSTTYRYRVRAFNAAGASDPSNEAVATTPAAPAETFELSLATTGGGSGNITGPGLDCGSIGSDCSQTFESGTSVTLTATADDGSSLAAAAWEGCTVEADLQVCSLDVTSATVVTARFERDWSVDATLELPASDDDGTYDLSWTWTGDLIPTSVSIEEAPDTSFTTVEFYTGTGTSYTFTEKDDGTYCYRLNLISGYTEPACITVLRPEASDGVLGITNNSSYDVVSLRINETELLSSGQVLPVGADVDLPLSPGPADLFMANGYYPCDTCAPTEFFTLSTSETVTAGETAAVTFNNPTLEQVLSAFSTSHTWKGEWFDANANMYFATFEFFEDGSWTLWSCPVFGTPELVDEGSGVTLQSWPARSPYIEFRIGTDTEDLLLNAADGFSSFKMNNGPESWRIIEYTAGLSGDLCSP